MRNVIVLAIALSTLLVISRANAYESGTLTVSPNELIVTVGEPVSFTATMSTDGYQISLTVPNLDNQNTTNTTRTSKVTGTASKPGPFTVTASAINPSTGLLAGPILAVLKVKDTLTLSRQSGTVKDVPGHGLIGKPGSFTYYANSGSTSTSIVITVNGPGVSTTTPAANGSQSVTFSATSDGTYTITAVGNSGGVTVEKTESLTIHSPEAGAAPSAVGQAVSVDGNNPYTSNGLLWSRPGGFPALLRAGQLNDQDIDWDYSVVSDTFGKSDARSWSANVGVLVSTSNNFSTIWYTPALPSSPGIITLSIKDDGAYVQDLSSHQKVGSATINLFELDGITLDKNGVVDLSNGNTLTGTISFQTSGGQPEVAYKLYKADSAGGTTVAGSGSSSSGSYTFTIPSAGRYSIDATDGSPKTVTSVSVLFTGGISITPSLVAMDWNPGVTPAAPVIGLDAAKVKIDAATKKVKLSAKAVAEIGHLVGEAFHKISHAYAERVPIANLVLLAAEAKKASAELKRAKEDHQAAVDDLNAAVKKLAELEISQRQKPADDYVTVQTPVGEPYTVTIESVKMRTTNAKFGSPTTPVTIKPLGPPGSDGKQIYVVSAAGNLGYAKITVKGSNTGRSASCEVQVNGISQSDVVDAVDRIERDEKGAIIIEQKTEEDMFGKIALAGIAAIGGTVLILALLGVAVIAFEAIVIMAAVLGLALLLAKTVQYFTQSAETVRRKARQDLP